MYLFILLYKNENLKIPVSLNFYGNSIDYSSSIICTCCSVSHCMDVGVIQQALYTYTLFPPYFGGIINNAAMSKCAGKKPIFWSSPSTEAEPSSPSLSLILTTGLGCPVGTLANGKEPRCERWLGPGAWPQLWGLLLLLLLLVRALMMNNLSSTFLFFCYFDWHGIEEE